MYVSYKAMLVKEYLEKYPSSTTNAIARILFNDFPNEFKNFESARGLVRYHRGESTGGSAKNKRKSKKTSISKDRRRKENGYV